MAVKAFGGKPILLREKFGKSIDPEKVHEVATKETTSITILEGVDERVELAAGESLYAATDPAGDFKKIITAPAGKKAILRVEIKGRFEGV